MLRRPTSEPDVLDVELVEIDADGPVDRDHTPMPSDPARPGPRPRRRLLVAGAAVALVVAVGAAQVVELGRSPTAGVVDGRIGAVPTAPEQLWHATGSHWSFVDGDTVVHGAGRGVTLRDVRTGDVVGERADLGQCEPATDGFVTGQFFPVVLCTRGPFIEDGVSTMRLTALAPSDGRTLWEHDLRSSRWTSMLTVVDGPVDEQSAAADEDSAADLLWAVQDDSTVHVVRLDLLEGTVRWSTEHESPADSGAWLQVLGGHLAVGDGLMLDLATGESTGVNLSNAPWTEEVEVPVPGGAARTTWVDGRGTLTVVAPDGTERFTLDLAIPVAWNSLVSDRADVLAVVEGQRYVVVDALSGAELWELPVRADLAGLDVVAYLPDVMIVMVETDLRAFAPRTGEVLWSIEEAAESWTTRVVDERRLVTPTRIDGAPALTALDVQTGEEAWRVPLPSPVHSLNGFHAADGVLVVQMESGTVAFATG